VRVVHTVRPPSTIMAGRLVVVGFRFPRIRRERGDCIEGIGT
jgi:hypothetical protein